MPRIKKVNPKRMLIQSLEEAKLLIASPYIEIIRFEVIAGVTHTTIHIELQAKDIDDV